MDVLSVARNQRPYMYNQDRITSLISAIIRAFITRTPQSAYCMGNIVLCAKAGSPNDFDIIDGQQRLITITIMIAQVAQLSGDAEIKQYVHGLFRREFRTAELAGLAKSLRYHLDLGIHDEPYRTWFDEDVHAINGLDILRIDAPNLGRTQIEKFRQRINRNAHYIAELLSDVNANDYRELIGWVWRKCKFITIFTPNQETAHTMFSVLNMPGMPLPEENIILTLYLQRLGNLTEAQQASRIREWRALMRRTSGQHMFTAQQISPGFLLFLKVPSISTISRGLSSRS